MQLKNDDKWLFKYTSFNINALSIITNNKLWFGEPDIQNDPNEAEFLFNLKFKGGKTYFKFPVSKDFEKEIRGLKGMIGVYPNEGDYFGVDKELEYYLKAYMRKYVGICSFSIRFDDILMWSHYADSNGGMCIVFNKEKLSRSLIQVESGKVDYVTTFPKGNLVDYRDNVGCVRLSDNFLFKKFRNWSSEDEYRFVIVPNQNMPTLDVNLKRLRMFSPESIEGIIVGSKMSHSHFETLCNLLLFNPQYTKVKLFQSIKDINNNVMNVQILDKDGFGTRANIIRSVEKKENKVKSKRS
ncbi:DUF2971 domain-containing protein [Labilibacter marinus]|uniref:DUF2971 domain-containing protein n=1 Tax=Labilibacter marinus TaxID=1477105 RepID=UPI000832FDA4|nr:DUF2971 domain-containing protein [Labilibacter marinus]